MFPTQFGWYEIQKNCWKPTTYSIYLSIPVDPCMAHFPTFTIKIIQMIDKYYIQHTWILWVCEKKHMKKPNKKPRVYLTYPPRRNRSRWSQQNAVLGWPNVQWNHSKVIGCCSISTSEVPNTFVRDRSDLGGFLFSGCFFYGCFKKKPLVSKWFVIMIYSNIKLEIEPHKKLWESVWLLQGLINHWFPFLRPAIKALFLKGSYRDLWRLQLGVSKVLKWKSDYDPKETGSITPYLS